MEGKVKLDGAPQFSKTPLHPFDLPVDFIVTRVADLVEAFKIGYRLEGNSNEFNYLSYHFNKAGNKHSFLDFLLQVLEAFRSGVYYEKFMGSQERYKKFQELGKNNNRVGISVLETFIKSKRETLVNSNYQALNTSRERTDHLIVSIFKNAQWIDELDQSFAHLLLNFDPPMAPINIHSKWRPVASFLFYLSFYEIIANDFFGVNGADFIIANFKFQDEIKKDQLQNTLAESPDTTARTKFNKLKSDLKNRAKKKNEMQNDLGELFPIK